MGLIELRTNPSQKERAWFGLLLLPFAGLLGLTVWQASGTLMAPRYIWSTGVVLAAVYYVVPPLRPPMFAAWMYAAYPIGWLVSHTLLALIYFGLLTPIGRLMRTLGCDPLQRSFDRTAASYWVEREEESDDTRYFRQY